MVQALAFKNGDKTAARVVAIERPDGAMIDKYRPILEDAKEVIIDLLNQLAYAAERR